MIQLQMSEELEALLPGLQSWLSRRGIEVHMQPTAQSATRWELSKRKEKLKPRAAGPLLVTERELEVLRLIEQGMSTYEIADTLCRSKHTIDTHRKNLLSKFQAKNAVDLINKARDQHYL